MLHPKPKHKRHKRRAKRDPEAQAACLKRDGKCLWCGRIDETLVGHHFKSFGAHGSDDLMCMATLCGRCHRTVHQGYLLVSVCNHREILAEQSSILAASATGGESKIWEADKMLERIVEEAYGETAAS